MINELEVGPSTEEWAELVFHEATGDRKPLKRF